MPSFVLDLCLFVLIIAKQMLSVTLTNFKTGVLVSMVGCKWLGDVAHCTKEDIWQLTSISICSTLVVVSDLALCWKSILKCHLGRTLCMNFLSNGGL